MRVVAMISGGKDSCYNMMQCVAEGFSNYFNQFSTTKMIILKVIRLSVWPICIQKIEVRNWVAFFVRKSCEKYVLVDELRVNWKRMFVYGSEGCLMKIVVSTSFQRNLNEFVDKISFAFLTCSTWTIYHTTTLLT